MYTCDVDECRDVAGRRQPHLLGARLLDQFENGQFADALFRRLLVTFVANGIASAVPATLVLFFIADVLREESRQGLFLALYFIAGAAGMPLWVKLSERSGKVTAWALAMAAAIVAFIWAWWLGPGDTAAFAAICVLSGLALGAAGVAMVSRAGPIAPDATFTS